MVVAGTPKQGVIPPGPIQEVIPTSGLQEIIALAAHQLLGDVGTDQQVVASSANDLNTIIEVKIQPTRDITERGIAIAIFV